MSTRQKAKIDGYQPNERISLYPKLLWKRAFIFMSIILLSCFISGLPVFSKQLHLDASETTDVRGNQPSDVVITPDGSRVYVTAMGTHNVFVIDTETNVITDVIDLWEDDYYGAWPFRMAITPDGTKIYVANMISDNISVIDTGTNRLVAAIDMGHFLHDVAFTPDGRFAYVELGWDRVLVIDVATNTVVETILLNEYEKSHTLAASHDGSKVYVVTSATGGTVYVIDVATNEVIDRFELGETVNIQGNQGIITISTDDSKLYLPCGVDGTTYSCPDEGLNKIFVIDLASKSVTAEIDITGGPIAMRLSPDGELAYVSTFAAGKVFVVDLSNNTVIGEIEWGDWLSEEGGWRRRDLRDMAIAPDGSRLYITGWDADAVLVADLATRCMTDIIELNDIMTQLWEIAITPDGSRVYVSSDAVESEARSSLFVIDTATNSIVDEIVWEPYPSNPYITPDGQLLYAVAGNEVLVIDVDTNEVTKQISLGDSVGCPYDIALIPGQDKAYITDVGLQYVYVVDLASSTVVKNIDVGWYPHMVVATPDGTRAYVSRQNNPYNIGGLAIIDTATDQVIDTIEPPVGMGPNSKFAMLVITPDETYVYWATSPASVNVVEIASNQVVKTISDLGLEAQNQLGYPRGINPSDIGFTSDGSRGYIPCGDSFYVVVIDVATGAILDHIIDIGIEPVAIVITPDDKFAYVTNRESESISVIDLATNSVAASISTREYSEGTETAPEVGEGEAGGGCFIATACYGSGLSQEVKVLSRFRDRYLERSSLGRSFVKIYYRVSPPVAEFISDKPFLKLLVKIQLKPWVKIAGLVMDDVDK